MKNAGLKKYSMELGGKSPVLIFEDADIERALDAALFTIFSINGERCTAGSRIFIQQSIYPEFVKRFAERANRLRVGDPNDPNTQVGALISQQHWEKVSGYIRLGIEEGATLLAGGPDKPLLRPLFGIVMIFVGIVGANGSVIMPALFVDAGRQVAELGLFSSMMGAGGLLGIAIHASVGARISAQNWLAVAFCGSAAHNFFSPFHSNVKSISSSGTSQTI